MKDEETIFKEYNKSEEDNRWRRLKWAKEKEREFDVENLGVLSHIRMLFHNSTLSYVYGNYIASILSICSALEAFLSSKISASKITDRKYLSGYIKDAFDEKIIAQKTYKELKNFNNTVRNNLVHPKGPLTTSMLGFKNVHFSGKKSTWESPDRKPMHPLTMQEAAEKGILLFVTTVSEWKKKQSKRA